MKLSEQELALRFCRLLDDTRESMLFRGHNPGMSDSWIVSSGVEAKLTCKTCGKNAWVATNPAPNGIEISGEAVALNCNLKENG